MMRGCMDTVPEILVFHMCPLYYFWNSGSTTANTVDYHVHGKRSQYIYLSLARPKVMLQWFVVPSSGQLSTSRAHAELAYRLTGEWICPGISRIKPVSMGKWLYIQPSFCFVLSFFAMFNNFSVIWWRSIFIGGRNNPDTLYNVFGERPPAFRK
jgi:hypothetical protein